MDEQDEIQAMNSKDRESLAELLQEARKQSKLIRSLLLVNTILAAALIIALAVIIPKLTTAVSNTESVLADAQRLTKQAEASLDGIDELVENANTILVENASGISEALENLSEAIAPLVDLAKIFQ